MRKMKLHVLLGSALLAAFCFSAKVPVNAAEATIKSGVYVDQFDLSGMTEEEAQQTIENYVNNLKNIEITLIAAQGKEVKVTAGELGLTWKNPEVIDEAVNIGIKGNVIERYKLLKDLEHDTKVYDLELGFDVIAMNDIVVDQCRKYDVKAVDAGLVRANNAFTVIPGRNGYAVEIDPSVDRIYESLEDWNREPARIELCISTVEPRGKTEELAQVKDVLGSFTTYFVGSGFGRAENIRNGCKMINGTLLYPGDEFSANTAMAPFTEANGYYAAGSYVNGQVVDSLGGGVCQISTTLYNAVLRAELEVTMRYNHSMTVGYVDLSADAALAEEVGKDFMFKNNTDYPIYIEGYITNNEEVTFKVYGKETRPASHSVSFESELIETIPPSADVITVDGGQPVGYLSYQGSHTGYKARLWKITYENGVQVSREQVNSSSYKMTPRVVVVGTATDNPEIAARMNEAIASGSVDVIRGTIAELSAPQAVPEGQGQGQGQEAEE